jgi:glycosidase
MVKLVSPTLNLKRLTGETVIFEVEALEDIQVEVINHILKETIELVKVNKTYQAVVSLNDSGFYTYGIRYKAEFKKSWEWLQNEAGEKVEISVQVDPNWVEAAIFYCVFVRFFKGKTTNYQGYERGIEPLHGSDREELFSKLPRTEDTVMPGEGGTFDDVKAHLDTLHEMGVRALYFNPIHLIGQLYRGYNMMDGLPSYLQPGSPYSIKDYKSIDPELTYDKDTQRHLLSDPHKEFLDLIEAAHEREMYVIMDMVFNHTAHDFIFQRIRPEWYLYKERITSLSDPYLYPEDVQKGLPWGDPRHTMAPYDHGMWWEDAAQLNWEYMLPEAPNEPPPNYSLKEMWNYFKSIPKYWIKHFGVDGFRCDIAYRIPPAFWKECISEARAVAKANKKNLAQDTVFIAEAYTNNLEMLQKVGFTAVYGDYSNKLSNPLNLKGYLDYMYNLETANFPENSRWFIFPESHDFGRTPEKVAGNDSQNQDIALRANTSRWLLTATLPGMPLIFNGFEKIEWQPVNLFSYGAVDWERNTDLREFIARVNSIRNESVALQKGSYVFLDTNQGVCEKTQIFAFLRETAEQQMLVVVNMDLYDEAGPTIIYLPERFASAYELRDMLTGINFEREGRELIVKLPPGEGHIFKISFG